MSNTKRISAILAQPAANRYEHFIKRAADLEEVWGLFKEGWALASTDEGQQVFPVWPESEFAALCATDDWAGYEPTAIDLQEFMTELLPRLQADKVGLGVFYGPQSRGALPPIEQVIEDLSTELSRYD